MTPRVWNVGLPRTGTTSVTDALKRLGFECLPVVAQWAGEAWSGRPDVFEGRTVPDDVPLICTVREPEEWLVSAKRWRPAVDPTVLEASLDAHSAWLAGLQRTRVIGYVSVHEGYTGLLHALCVGYADPHLVEQNKLPHLNASAPEGYPLNVPAA